MCDRGAAALPAEVVTSMVSAFQQSALALCAVCHGVVFSCSSGPTLRGDVRKLVGRAIEEASGLLQSVVRTGRSHHHSTWAQPRLLMEWCLQACSGAVPAL